MTMHPEAKIAAGEEEWEPNFVDYLFLAFNTSTAFSPTECTSIVALGKDSNDDSSNDFSGCHCLTRRSCSEHPLIDLI
jgi:hypothetical protein